MAEKVKECKNCDKEFSKPPSWAYEQWEKKKFCTKDCYHKFEGHEQHGKSKGTETECDHCGKNFTRSRHKQEYCSISCSNKHQYEKGYRDKDKQTDKANKAMRQQGMEKFRENPTTRISKRGYRLIYIPADHPNLDPGWMKMHHYVWWKEKGELPPVEDTNQKNNGNVMHHIDGDKLNNNIDNLEIMKNNKHTEMHQNP